RASRGGVRGRQEAGDREAPRHRAAGRSGDRAGRRRYQRERARAGGGARRGGFAMMPPKKGARAEVKSVIDPHEEERRPSINPSNRRVSRPKLPPELSQLPLEGEATNAPEAPPEVGAPAKPPSRFMAIARAVAGAALVIGVSVSVAWAARHYVMTTPRFAVREIAVTGQSRRSADDIATEAGIAR